MNYAHNPKLTPIARTLRKNMTKEEKKLWYVYLRRKPFRVLRQKVVDNYVLDFYYSKGKIAIELDGSQHYSEQGLLKDAIRTERLEQYGITIYRIPNGAVNYNFDGVCEYLDLIFGNGEYKE